MTERWENEHGDQLTLTPVAGGYDVQLHTTRPEIGEEHRQPTRHDNLGDASERAAFLLIDVADGYTSRRLSLPDEASPQTGDTS